MVTANPVVPSSASTSTTSVPSTLMPKDWRLCRYSGYFAMGVAMWSSIQWPDDWSW